MLRIGLWELKSKQGLRVYVDTLGIVLGYGDKQSQQYDITTLIKLGVALP